MSYLLCLHLVVRLLKRVDFAADQLNFLDVTGDYEGWLAWTRPDAFELETMENTGGCLC